MAQVLGLGITHVPNLASQGNMCARLEQRLRDPALPERLRSIENWPPAMRKQWGEDRGQAHAAQHRLDLIEQFRKARAELDAFNPDFVLIWGDDQYENFRDDCVPSFSVLAYDAIEFRPWKNYRRGRNAWDEPEDQVFAVKGHRPGGKYLAQALLQEGIDVAYAYKPLHHPLGHAFANSILYLDYDRKGFTYPVLPFAVNAYGRLLTAQNSQPITSEAGSQRRTDIVDFDPPAPQPWRCFQVGRVVARALVASSWRVAVVASSSWSHSFLTEKHDCLYPDVSADRRCYQALTEGDWDFWSGTKLEEIEASGQQELLNWFCLAGAMRELGRSRPDASTFLESWVTTSDKVFAVFRPRP